MAKKVTAKQLKSNKKEQTIKVDGREYVISFNFGVMGELEDIYGDINTALNELQKGKVKALTNLMYAVMVQEEGNEDLTPRKVGKMLDMDFINELTGKMGKAMVDGFGETEETEDLGE
ncbi:hypothetical protein [Clostridium sp. C2-6-12]|uniref:hypothetical protein n=1 Tax=Clostridium sp. C2-6-12 TaxID=2698832 RepID=UPI00136FD9F4|nr:hypothetical protein [Clostridium sp. C2-6-12]